MVEVRCPVGDFANAAVKTEMGFFQRLLGSVGLRGADSPGEFDFLKIPGGESLDDESLLGGIRTTFEGKLPVVGALFLVAYENLFVVRIAFDRCFRDSKECPATTDNFVRWLAYERSKYKSSSIHDEANNRRYFYFYVAALLKIAQSRAEKQPALWDKIADIWILLLPGARALRKTLDSTQLWPPDEVEFFANVKTEGQGENHCLQHVAPPEVRDHKKIDDYLWKDTPQEMRDQIERTIEGDMKRWRGDGN
jgi:hypothetical protein